MRTKEAAIYLGLSPLYLRNMRQGLHSFDGPRCTPILQGARGYNYTQADLDAWNLTHVRRPRGRYTRAAKVALPE